SDDVLPDADHGAARRCRPAVGTRAGCHTALPAVRVALGQFSQPLLDHPRTDLHRHRLRATEGHPVGSREDDWQTVRHHRTDSDGGRMMSEILALSGVSKRFGGLTAVNELSFSLNAGEVVGLLGPNGSGKTTVMNMISGFF